MAEKANTAQLTIITSLGITSLNATGTDHFPASRQGSLLSV